MKDYSHNTKLKGVARARSLRFAPILPSHEWTTTVSRRVVGGIDIQGMTKIEALHFSRARLATDEVLSIS